MELNEAGAERLRTPSSSDSGVDAEVRRSQAVLDEGHSAS